MALWIVTLLAIGFVGLALVVSSRRRQTTAGLGSRSFRCRIAVWDGNARDRSGGALAEPNWSPTKARAKWRGDVLVIHHGRLRIHNLRIPVTLPASSMIREECGRSVRGLGARPQSLVVRRKGNQMIKIAVKRGDRDRLAGPFVVMAFATSR